MNPEEAFGLLTVIGKLGLAIKQLEAQAAQAQEAEVEDAGSE